MKHLGDYMLYTKITNQKTEIFFHVKETIEHFHSDKQEIFVGDLSGLGKTVIINGELQSTETTQEAYHRTLTTFNYFIPYARYPGATALVLGAGEGISVNLLLKARYYVTAVDYDPEFVEMSRKHLSDWNERIYDRTNEFKLVFDDAAEYLKRLPDNSFDYIIYDLDTEQASKLADDCMKEIYRVLKTGGKLSMQDGPAHSDPAVSPVAAKYFQKGMGSQEAVEWRFTSVTK